MHLVVLCRPPMWWLGSLLPSRSGTVYEVRSLVERTGSVPPYAHLIGESRRRVVPKKWIFSKYQYLEWAISKIFIQPTHSHFSCAFYLAPPLLHPTPACALAAPPPCPLMTPASRRLHRDASLHGLRAPAPPRARLHDHDVIRLHGLCTAPMPVSMAMVLELLGQIHIEILIILNKYQMLIHAWWVVTL
jgi:hypothetical protein